jgi:putative tricarboxylic transport membrane protein
VKKYDRIAAAFLALVGIAAGVHAWVNLHLGSMKLPDSGFMPFIAGTVLAVSSILWFLQSMGADANAHPFWEGRGWLKPTLAAVMMLFYAFTRDKIGYLLSTLVFMLIWQFFLEREKWLKATLVSAIATLAMWLLFSKLLGVPLPTGILGV